MTGLESHTLYLPPILFVRSRPLSADQTQGEVNKLHLSKGGVSETSWIGLKTKRPHGTQVRRPFLLIPVFLVQIPSTAPSQPITLYPPLTRGLVGFTAATSLFTSTELRIQWTLCKYLSSPQISVEGPAMFQKQSITTRAMGMGLPVRKHISQNLRDNWKHFPGWPWHCQRPQGPQADPTRRAQRLGLSDGCGNGRPGQEVGADTLWDGGTVGRHCLWKVAIKKAL